MYLLHTVQKELLIEVELTNRNISVKCSPLTHIDIAPMYGSVDAAVTLHVPCMHSTDQIAILLEATIDLCFRHHDNGVTEVNRLD